ncbi:MAG: hypothetical protein SO262_00535 [Lentihominibacter sp.]|nr:hypothetical protein [Lentihominibacter sp.]
MAFFDWNHDGKKNYVDTAIEMMILDDIEEEEKKEAAAGVKAKPRYKKKESTMTDEQFKVFINLLLILPFIGMTGVLLSSIIDIWNGRINWISMSVSIITIVLIVRHWIKLRNSSRTKK